MTTNDTEDKKKKRKKIIRNVIILVIAVLSVFMYSRYFFVYGTGTNAGVLNFVVHEGYVFKTYEGKMILTGFRGGSQGSTLLSNEFEFSVIDKSLADSLMLLSGKEVQLHYKRYLGALPWRGSSRYIVDHIVSISSSTRDNSIR